MIAHFSIPSENPKETALFFAAIIDGIVFDFPVVAGASIAVARDNSGTAVEVYPPSMVHHPGTGQPDPTIQPEGPAAMPWEDQIYAEQIHRRPSSFHLAIETKLSEAEVISRSQSLGWRTVACNRGGVFGVVEVWVDNLYLVEVLVTEEAGRYRNFMNTTGCAAMFGSGIAPQ
ncbi:MAG TPA: hypothetical protein DEG17_09265 [Cyanobacteria bacterium UBA11149]|nr:hypothetical protein [Cyanobacteria bacterium UBA11367]HBE57501.1 hypothetical protein [Cyanobacteria bacterium UBA11366]HBR73595.1 hypothetical protein [Cyanobacteria bacterium UBA11159]HBS68104.1 hypothetical protein [Cyanobacteria bacterium UBA11153]HBW89039.1 hypothetical protein [Cyanobacteria bacterium UBA11149]HCA96725.1 hypothetical protein [Cyanobacteria bacterium UBA9226]